MNNFKDGLDTQSPYLWIIFGRKNSPLTKDFNFYYEKLTAWCKVNAKMWCFIGHDKDIDDDGNPKFRHIHALIILKDGLKPRLSTSLNRLSKVVDILPQDIDIEVAKCLNSCIRYCVHKGYPDKYPYPIDELQTNLNNEDLESFLNTEENSITASYLINLIILHGCSVMSIMKQIGLKSYMKYRGAIKDIIEELKEING